MTPSASPGGRWLQMIAIHLVFGGLILLASEFRYERIIHIDTAFQFFKWIQADGISVEAHRYPAVGPQLVVKAASMAGMGLKGLMLLASVMHVLLPWAIAAWLAHGWRMTWLGMGTALAAVLCTRLTFFGPVLEAHYLLSLPFLFAGALVMLAREPGRRDRALVAWLAAAAVLLVHPTGFLLAIFVSAFLWSVVVVPRRVAWPFMLTAALWPLLRPVLLPPTGYERGLMDAPTQALGQLDSFLSWPSWSFVVRHTWADTTTYLPALVLLVLLVVWMVRERLWAPLALSLVAMAGYLLLHLLAYHTGEAAMMLEKNQLPLATLIALPLAWLAGVHRPHTARIAAAVLLVVAFVQARGIAFAARDLQLRLERQREWVGRLRQEGMRKVVVDPHEVDRLRLGVSWALPFETLLLSALDGPDAAVTALPGTPTRVDEGDLLLPPWSTDSHTSDLDPHYFRLPEGPYRYLAPAAP